MENKILVVDIETTGLDKVKDCIVEIGAAEIDLKTGIITGVFNSLCREKHLTAKHRDAWIFSNSDLTRCLYTFQIACELARLDVPDGKEPYDSSNYERRSNAYPPSDLSAFDNP